MAICGTCGRENAEGMLFCTNCGATIPDTPAHGGLGSGPSSVDTLVINSAPQTSPTNWPNIGDSYRSPAQPVPASGKSRTGLIVGMVAAVLLLVILAAGGFGYYFYSRSSNEVANGNNNQGVYTPSTGNDSDDKSNSNRKASPTPTATPGKLFEPPTEPTKDASFTVYANGDWQLSEIAVLPLERYTTTVQGIVDLAGAKAGLRAGGTNDAQFKSRRLFQEWPTGALLMRTRYADGRFSNTTATSAGGATGSWENLPDERGMLEFRINDNQQQNNGGQFTIRKRHTSLPKSKS